MALRFVARRPKRPVPRWFQLLKIYPPSPIARIGPLWPRPSELIRFRCTSGICERLLISDRLPTEDNRLVPHSVEVEDHNVCICSNVLCSY